MLLKLCTLMDFSLVYEKRGKQQLSQQLILKHHVAKLSQFLVGELQSFLKAIEGF